MRAKIASIGCVWLPAQPWTPGTADHGLDHRERTGAGWSRTFTLAEPAPVLELTLWHHFRRSALPPVLGIAQEMAQRPFGCVEETAHRGYRAAAVVVDGVERTVLLDLHDGGSGEREQDG
jgi:hypothetical protein